jgi:hypothetical protein
MRPRWRYTHRTRLVMLVIAFGSDPDFAFVVLAMEM